MPNRSLDDFVGGGEEGTETDASDAEADDAEAEPEATEAETSVSASATETPKRDDEADDEAEPTLTVEEATPTYDFSPDGSTCEACGETVETRWHAAEVGMVCSDCKGW